jgi:Uma2 family endonuclease
VLAPRRPPSLDKFLSHLDEDDWTEWVQGEVITLPPGSSRHQSLMLFLIGVMALLIEARHLGKLWSAPFLMVLRDQDCAREPDLLFVRREHTDRIRDSHLEGPADLVVEIVSPESVSRDRGEKFVEYEAAGIPEYWLLDPLRKLAQVYRLQSVGEGPDRYRLVSTDPDGFLRSQVLEGFRLRPEWLWRDPLPKVLDVARELGILD